MEWVGIPSATVVHEALAGSANSMRVISKFPTYPYILVHFPLAPTGVWPKDELEELCDRLIPQIVDQLTKPLEL